jgi:hypothetical protein
VNKLVVLFASGDLANSFGRDVVRPDRRFGGGADADAAFACR